MAISPGARIGSFEVVSILGAGGMGEVYRARDVKLGRDVALKSLPTLFGNDPERVARLQREAQLLASLNHPHIAAIYGLEQVDDAQFLVLELVEGDTLAEISPDGHWLAYQSDKSGQFDVYVVPFPDVNGGLWQVSNAGGTRPKWSADGRELFFLDAKNLLTAVSITTQGAAFSAGNPRRLLEKAYVAGSTTRGFDLRAYDVSGDGQRFLMVKESNGDNNAAPAPVNLNVVLNWEQELKSRVQPKR